MKVKSDYWLDTEGNEDGVTSFDLSADVRIFCLILYRTLKKSMRILFIYYIKLNQI